MCQILKQVRGRHAQGHRGTDLEREQSCVLQQIARQRIAGSRKQRSAACCPESKRGVGEPLKMCHKEHAFQLLVETY